MALIPPPWLQEVVRLTEHTPKGVHAQILVVLEAYQRTPDHACPFISPTLECGDCGTDVMLHESRTVPLKAEWWEVVGCHHERGHLRCMPVYQAHSRRRCDTAMRMRGRSPLPWVFDGTP